MERLDDEILVKILSCIPLSKCKVASQAVCKSWARALLRAESHQDCPEDNLVETYSVCSQALPFKLLKVLPIAQDDRRYEAGGHEHIRTIIQGPSSESLLPAIMSCVTHLELTSVSCLSNSSLLTRERFPRLQSLNVEIDSMNDARLNLTELIGLKWVEIECGEFVPNVDLPTDCKLKVSILDQSSLEVPESVLYRVDELYWASEWCNEETYRLDLSQLAACKRLHEVEVNILNVENSEDPLFVIDLSSLGSSVREISCSGQERPVKVAFVCCAGWITKPEYGGFVASRSERV